MRRRHRAFRRNAPIKPAEVRVLSRILRRHGYRVNPYQSPEQAKAETVKIVKKRNPRRRKVSRRAKKVRRARVVRPPKGKRIGSHFKRRGRWFRVTRIKVRRGRRKVSRRVARKSTFRAAMRARK
jgi:UDP-N-acetylenolpyruvoylglucosamine reductase